MSRIVVILSLFFSVALSAQIGILKGSVTDINQLPLEGATIILQPSNKGVYADNRGNFQFKKLNYGVYTLQISKIGYQKIEKKVKLVKPITNLSFQLIESIEDLSEVIVVNNHRESLKRRQSLNVQEVKSEFIQQNLSGSLIKSLEKLPGISTISIGSGQSKPIIRGLSFNRVLVADKGVKHEAQQWGADHGLEIDQFAVNDIEIIKGPASLAYGSEAVGGVIHIKTPPLPEVKSFHGELNTSYMSNNSSLSGSLAFSKRFNHFFFTLRGTGVAYADYKVPADTVNIYDYKVGLHKKHVRNTAGEEYSYHINTGYVSDRIHSIFYGSSYYTKAGFFANAHGLEPIKVDNQLYDKSSKDIDKPLQRVHHYKLTNKTVFFSDAHTLSLITSVQRNKRAERSNYVAHGFMPAVYPDSIANIIPFDLERKFIKNYYTCKVVDDFHLDKHRFKVGVETNYTKNTIGGWGFIIPDFNRFNLGVFAINQYQLSEKIVLNGGVRYDWGIIDIHKYIDWFPSEGENGQKLYLQRVGDISRTFNNISFSAGFNYNLESFHLKTNIGKSFRMPIAKELAANGVNYHYFRYEKGNEEISPEHSYQLDISAEWNHKNFTFQLSPFLNYFPNYIYLNPTPKFDYLYGAGNQVFEYSQSKVFRYGGEFIANIKYRHFQLDAVAEYVKSVQLSGKKKGFGLPFSPPFSLMISPKYTFHSSNTILNPYLSFDYKYVATQNDIVPPEKVTQAYQLLNVNFGSQFMWDTYKFNLAVQVQNIADTRYFNHTNFYRLIDLPEQGRNVVLSLKMEF